MTNSKQIQMVMRDMLFVTWAVSPERARKLIGGQLQLDTLANSNGRVCAFASAVCFNVADVRSSSLPIGRLSFGQVNYRLYVKADEVPAVCFLDMKVNSRMVTALTSFLGVPIHYEDIQINAAEDHTGSVRYRMKSDGLCVEALTGGHDSASSMNPSPGFITDRLVGFVLAGDSMFRIDVEQPGLESAVAGIVSAKAPRLEQLGLLNAEETRQPHSALYVRETLFGANMPTRV